MSSAPPHKTMSLPRVSSLHSSYHEATTSSSGENLDQDATASSTKETKRKNKFHPFRAVRRIFRWGSKVKRFKCTEGQTENIVASKKSLSVGELRQVALDPMEDDNNIDTQDLGVGGQGGVMGGGMMGQSGALYSMGLSLSHDSVFSPDTSTPAEMGQIIHPVPVMTGSSITNSLFKNELFNRVRARRADEDSEDEDHGLPRSPCPATPTTVDVLQSPGNKVKARSTCSAGSLSSMLSSETDEDSLSAGASNSPNVADRNGQLSHKAALHKIAIKPKKNHTRRRPLRTATSTEPSLPATPEEKLHSEDQDDEELSAEQDIEMSASTSASSRPMSAEDLDYQVSSKTSPIPEAVMPSSLREDHRRSVVLEEKRRSCGLHIDETPPLEPVILPPEPMDEDEKPRRKPIGGVAMLNVSAIHEALAVSSRPSQVQRSKSMKQDSSTEEFRAEFRVSRVERKSECDHLDKSNSVQNSPVKKNLNVSSEFFQRSKSFSAKVSETHQALEGKNSKELNSPNTCQEEVIVDVRESIKSLERRKQVQPVQATSDEPASGSKEAAKGARRRCEDDEKLGPTTQSEAIKEDESAKSSQGSMAINMNSGGGGGGGDRPKSQVENLETVELRRKPSPKTTASAGDKTQSTEQNISIAGEPELFKVFARRSLKQKPVPHDDKIEVDQENKMKVKKNEKKTIEVELGGGTHEPVLKSAKLGDAKPDNSTEIHNRELPAKKKASPLNQTKSEKDCVIVPESGPISLPAFRRETDLKKQQSLEPNQGPKSLYMPTDNKQQQSKAAAVLQRASSMSTGTGSKPGVKENNKDEEEEVGVGGGQPEWLVLAQKKRETRELKEKMAEVATQNSKNETSAGIATQPQSASALRQSKVLDLVSNFQKLQMA